MTMGRVPSIKMCLATPTWNASRENTGFSCIGKVLHNMGTTPDKGLPLVRVIQPHVQMAPGGWPPQQTHGISQFICETVAPQIPWSQAMKVFKSQSTLHCARKCTGCGWSLRRIDLTDSNCRVSKTAWLGHLALLKLSSRQEQTFLSLFWEGTEISSPLIRVAHIIMSYNLQSLFSLFLKNTAPSKGGQGSRGNVFCVLSALCPFSNSEGGK